MRCQGASVCCSLDVWIQVTHLLHLLALFTSFYQSIVPRCQVSIASRSLGLPQELLRGHTSKFGHLVLWQEGTGSRVRLLHVLGDGYIPKIADLHVELLHTAVDLLTRRRLAVDSELIALRPSTQSSPDDKVGLALGTLQLNLDVTIFGTNLHKRVQFRSTTEDLEPPISSERTIHDIQTGSHLAGS
jgi:hypothetical protein